MKKGLIHIYTGDGKGKTTCAIGLSIRAWGRGFKVLFVQFLKGSYTGELTTFEKLGERFEIRRGGELKKFVWNMTEAEFEIAKKDTKDLFNKVIKEINETDYDLLVLDEIMGSITNNFIESNMVADFLIKKPIKLEVALTGRNAPQDLIELADYVSELKAVKHPAEKGIGSRVGIEV